MASANALRSPFPIRKPRSVSLRLSNFSSSGSFRSKIILELPSEENKTKRTGIRKSSCFPAVAPSILARIESSRNVESGCGCFPCKPRRRRITCGNGAARNVKDLKEIWRLGALQQRPRRDWETWGNASPSPSPWLKSLSRRGAWSIPYKSTRSYLEIFVDFLIGFIFRSVSFISLLPTPRECFHGFMRRAAFERDEQPYGVELIRWTECFAFVNAISTESVERHLFKV